MPHAITLTMLINLKCSFSLKLEIFKLIHFLWNLKIFNIESKIRNKLDLAF